MPVPVAGIVSSTAVAYATARIQTRAELRRWRHEFRLSYVDSALDSPKRAQALARQFALGVLIIDRAGDEGRDRVFVPPNCRITAGREAHNEIVIDDPLVSLTHAGFSADEHDVYIEHLGSPNGVYITRGTSTFRMELQSRMKLNPDDVVRLGSDAGIPIVFRPLSTH